MREIEDLKQDELKKLCQLHINTMALCTEQMDLIFTKWQKGNLQYNIYSQRLKKWEDSYFYSLRQIQLIQEFITE